MKKLKQLLKKLEDNNDLVYISIGGFFVSGYVCNQRTDDIAPLVSGTVEDVNIEFGTIGKYTGFISIKAK